jgi:hypothetical protein
MQFLGILYNIGFATFPTENLQTKFLLPSTSGTIHPLEKRSQMRGHAGLHSADGFHMLTAKIRNHNKAGKSRDP